VHSCSAPCVWRTSGGRRQVLSLAAAGPPDADGVRPVTVGEKTRGRGGDRTPDVAKARYVALGRAARMRVTTPDAPAGLIRPFRPFPNGVS